MILPMRAAALTAQFFLMMRSRSAHVTWLPFRLYRSRPSRCKGVEASWILAGATNWATVAPLMALFHSSPMRRASTGPSRGGTLKEAKMVMQSRMAKRAYEGSGTGRGGPPVGPNMRTKAWSLKTHRPMLAVEEAANLAVPEVTSVAGWLRTVEVAVSIVLEVR